MAALYALRTGESLEPLESVVDLRAAECEALCNTGGGSERHESPRSNGDPLAIGQSLGVALGLFEQRSEDSSAFDLVARNACLSRLLSKQSFGDARIVFRACTSPEDARNSPDWIATENGMRVAHGWLEVSEEHVGHAIKYQKTDMGSRSRNDGVLGSHTPRPLPVLLNDAICFNASSSAHRFFAWIVGEHIYQEYCPHMNGLWLWFPTGDGEYMNNHFWHQLGFTESLPEHKPSSWFALIDPNDLERAIANLKQTEASHGDYPYDLRVRYRRKTGDRCYVRCQGSPLLWAKETGKILALAGCHTDVTGVERDCLSRVSFVSKVSHELRTPLNTLAGSLELLRAKYASEPPDQGAERADANVMELWELLSHSIRQLRLIVDDVLDYSSLAAGKLRLNKTEVSMQRLLSDVLKAQRPSAEAKSIMLSCSIAPEVPKIIADEKRIGQVTHHLISNSIKFTPDGGSVRVLLTRPHKHEGRDNECTLQLDIIDTGCGIPKDRWESVFEQFEQVNNADATVGTGLGLAMSSQLLNLHGGTIRVHDSTLNEGTTIRATICVPVVKPREVSTSTESPAGKTAILNVPDFKSVLVVDDIQANRFVLSYHIRNINPGVDITVASNGQEAYDLVQSADQFDVIIMDLHMPVLNGIEATKMLVKKFPSVKIVGFTANTDNDVIEESKAAGMRSIIYKPSSQINVRTMLAEILS